jgi:hypothetical protein
MSDKNLEKKPRNKNFAKDDSELLVELASKFSKIINNKDTNKISIQQKQKAWVNITNNFNSQSLSGVPRKSEELISKYRNLKRIQKSNFAKERKALKATGGGPKQAATIPNVFNITDREIAGIPNIFDSNGDEMEIIELDVPPGYEVLLVYLV